MPTGIVASASRISAVTGHQRRAVSSLDFSSWYAPAACSSAAVIPARAGCGSDCTSEPVIASDGNSTRSATS